MNNLATKKILLIGASTGGPGEIQKIIDALPKLHDASVVIGQHMVEGFMQSFVSRLQNRTSNAIELVEDNQAFEASRVYVCEGETRLDNGVFRVKTATKNSYNPNINLLFNSFVPLCRKMEIICVILTGIGEDGVEACKNLSANGARCVTQDEKSAIVDGMPNRARASVPKIEVYSMNELVKTVSEFCR